MLSIVGQKSCERMAAEFGDCVPFKFRCGIEGASPHLYWRTGNLESTLLEVEISPIDGQIVGASLLLPGSVSKEFPALNLPEPVVGSPMVRIDDWPADRFLDESKPFQVFVDGSRLLILLSDAVATESIAAGNVTFGVCANSSLAWILASDLNPERLAELGG